MTRYDRLAAVLGPAARRPPAPQHRTPSAARRHAEAACGVPFVLPESEPHPDGGFRGVVRLREDQEYLRQRVEERGVPCLPRLPEPTTPNDEGNEP